MALTLSDILQAGYAELGQLNVNLATGGSTTTIVDTTQTDGDDDAWKDGAAFIVNTTDGLTPIGQFQRVSAFVAATGTLTVDTAFSTAIAAGDTYGLVGSYYPLRQMIKSVNDALRSLGDVDLTDTTTLDTADSTTEYAASVTWKRSAPFRVDIQTLTGSAGANAWRTSHDWEYVPAAAGTAGKIIFADYQPATRDIRVWYKGPHATVSAYGDVIAEVFDPETVVQAFIAKALEWQNTRSQGADQFLLQRGQKAEQALANLLVTRPRQRVKVKPKLLIVGASDPDDDQFTYPT
jgi:hypothetical protein